MSTLFDKIKRKATIRRNRPIIKTAFKKKKNHTHTKKSSPTHTAPHSFKKGQRTTAFSKYISKNEDKILRLSPSELINEWNLNTFRQEANTPPEYSASALATPLYKFRDSIMELFKKSNRIYKFHQAKIVDTIYDETLKMNNVIIGIHWNSPDEGSGYEEHGILVPPEITRFYIDDREIPTGSNRRHQKGHSKKKRAHSKKKRAHSKKKK
jgi:hypothetical protein